MAFNSNIFLLMPKVIVWDPDALAFIAAAGITNYTEKISINNLVNNLKSNSLWTLLDVIYPFIGGNSTSNRYNLKNPATFLITFTGGVTYNSNGVTFNGSTGYGNTFYIPSVDASLNDFSNGIYSRTSLPTGIHGSSVGLTQRTYIQTTGAPSINFQNWLSSGGGLISVATTDNLGLISFSRTASNRLEGYKRGISLGVNTTTQTGTRPNTSMLIGARRNGGSIDSYSNINAAWYHLGKGLSSAQEATLELIVQSYQTALGRNV